MACLIDNEKQETLRDALARLCLELHPTDGPSAVIRTDPAPGFVALTNDPVLQRLSISIDIGRVKNVNKNPVAERQFLNYWMSSCASNQEVVLSLI